MKRFTLYSLMVIAFISLIVGIIMLLVSFSQDKEELLEPGLICVLSFFLVHGFSIVVESSILNIEKHKGNNKKD